ncbi:unnamed protein product, partial [Ectocarpus fasciculatus]
MSEGWEIESKREVPRKAQRNSGIRFNHVQFEPPEFFQSVRRNALHSERKGDGPQRGAEFQNRRRRAHARRGGHMRGSGACLRKKKRSASILGGSSQLCLVLQYVYRVLPTTSSIMVL